MPPVSTLRIHQRIVRKRNFAGSVMIRCHEYDSTSAMDNDISLGLATLTWTFPSRYKSAADHHEDRLGNESHGEFAARNTPHRPLWSSCSVGLRICPIVGGQRSEERRVGTGAVR